MTSNSQSQDTDLYRDTEIFHSPFRPAFNGEAGGRPVHDLVIGVFPLKDAPEARHYRFWLDLSSDDEHLAPVHFAPLRTDDPAWEYCDEDATTPVLCAEMVGEDRITGIAVRSGSVAVVSGEETPADLNYRMSHLPR